MFKFVAATQKPLIIPVFIPHLGCKKLCAFCNQRDVTGVTEPTLEDVENAVKSYLSWSKPRERTEISFYGGTFTALPREKMMNYVKKGGEFVENGIVNALRCSTRPDEIDEERVEILKNSHFETVELGVQSMSEKLLEKMRRGHSAECVENAVRLLKNAGILVGLQFMTGFPYETDEDVEISCASLSILKPGFIRIYPFVPLKNTPVEREISSGTVVMESVETILERTVTLFLAAMKLEIPVVRIGLPQSSDVPEIYPANLFQVVVAKAISRLAEEGETEFCIPDNFETSFNMAKKEFPFIGRNFQK
jgi:histone acetyltransferase (RNA polymerase elongator complex component)